VLPILLFVLALAVVIAAGAWVVSELDSTNGANGGGGGGGNSGGGAAVTLQAVGVWDPPPGDGREHDEDVPLATDGNESTYWQTEDYRNPPDLNGKPGVGLVLDAGAPSSPSRIKVTSDTPGFNAEIQAGDSLTGPFDSISESQTVGTSATFNLQDAQARYFVVWITTSPPGGSAHVNEVTASS
jgi:putative peptidoglycan lipid II flippase